MSGFRSLLRSSMRAFCEWRYKAALSRRDWRAVDQWLDRYDRVVRENGWKK